MMVPATTVIYGVRLSVVIQTLTSQPQNPAVKQKERNSPSSP